MATVIRSKDIAINNSGIPILYVPRAQETTDLLAAMAVQPSPAIRYLANRTIVSLKNAGIWPKLRALYFFGLLTQQQAFTDWKFPARAAPTIAGTITHNPRGLLTTDGASHLDLGFSAASLGLAQDNIAVSTKFGSGSGPLFGTSGVSGNLLHMSVQTGGPMASRVNQTAAQDSYTLPANSGHVILSRAATDRYSRDHDGLSVGDAVVASSGVAAGNMVLFRQGSAYGTHPISHHAVSTALTTTERAAFYQIVTAFVEGIVTAAA